MHVKPVEPLAGPRAAKKRGNMPRRPRTGCILKRKNVVRVRQGRPFLPHGNRQLLLLARSESKTKKVLLDESIGGCTWATSTRGGLRAKSLPTTCCKNHHGQCAGLPAWEKEADGASKDLKQADMAVVISALRKYVRSLDKGAQREFITSHTYYSGYEIVDEETGETQLKKGQRLYTYYLPSLGDMKKRLRAAGKNVKMAEPAPNTLRRVCTQWFFFVTAMCFDKVYDASLRSTLWARGATASARALDVGVAVLGRRTQLTERDRPHTKATVAFLLSLAAVSEVLPNEDKGGTPTIVLPSRSALSTHQLCVFEAELAADCPWAAAQMTNLFTMDRVEAVSEAVAEQLLAAGDNSAQGLRKKAALDRLAELEEDRVAEAVNADDSDDGEAKRKEAMKRLRRGPKRQSRSAFRYNNRLCGLKDPLRPELLSLPKYDWFCAVWSNEPELAHIICRSYLPFAKCNVCVRQRSKASLRRTQEERENDVAETLQHLQEVSREKLCYYTHRTKARLSPKTFMSIIIDGADQSKYDLPFWCESSHASSEAKRLKMHLYGVLVHGRRSYVFVSPDHEEQGQNSTIQCLWEVIVDQYFANGKKLPNVLFLQLDNTTKQNKGRFLMAFLALLVHHGVFERIYVCFLPVGHTHEDIDQMFSRFAIALRGRNMLSRDDMTRVLEKGYTFEGGTASIVKHWDRLGNIRDWLDDQIGLPAGVMRFRHFRIARSEDRKVMLQCRLKMHLDMEEDWRGIEDNTHRTFLFLTVYGIPDLVADAERGAIPDSKKRNTPKETIVLMRAALVKLQKELPDFAGRHVIDCMAIVDLYATNALPFNWNLRHIKELFRPHANRCTHARRASMRAYV
jgi:general stress protein 26